MQSRQTLELRQRQQLALTPELQQSIRFLQLSAMELSQELAQAVLENPMLESESDYDTEDLGTTGVEEPVLTADWTGAGRRRTSRDDDSDDDPQPAMLETLQDHLLKQLSMRRVNARDDALIRALMYELDDDGYLHTSVPDVVASLQRYVSVSDTDVRSALAVLQSLDPPGVGARSLSECLILQLKQLPQHIHQKWPADVVECALRIAQDHLELLATGNLVRLRQALGCDSALLKAAHGLLLSLEPRPGRNWTRYRPHYVVPDVFVRRVQGQWRAFLNPEVLPSIRLNTTYSRLLDDTKSDHAPLREKLQQAQALIKNLHHRGETILRVAQAIVAHQHAYFEHGAQALRPLVLRDVARTLDIHESTVSRATRFKYAQTPQGVVELRSFFSSRLATQDGGTTSGSAVQSMIAQLIAAESRIKPLSDNKIAQHLEQRGVSVARRTVAKYREAAGIPPAIRRKAHYSSVDE